MDRIAFVFPGQGSQYVGMGKALAEASPAAATVLAEADDALGKSISRLAFDGPAEQLDLTVNSQPALVAVSIAFTDSLPTVSRITSPEKTCVPSSAAVKV